MSLVDNTTQAMARTAGNALYRATKAAPRRRFHALYDKVYRRDVLERGVVGRMLPVKDVR